MLIRCKQKTGQNLPVKDPEGLIWQRKDFPYLIIDKIYVVYAMTIYLGYIWYYLIEDDSDRYPHWRPSPLFDVVDGRLSKYWIFSIVDGHTTWAYPEWARDPYNYYDRLSDGCKNEEEIFRSYRKLMDLEFPNPSNTEQALIGDNVWLMCPKCIDAWESTSSDDGMVICPKCNTTMHNPRYKKGCAPGNYQTTSDGIYLINDSTI